MKPEFRPAAASPMTARSLVVAKTVLAAALTRETTLSEIGALFDRHMAAQPILLGDAWPPGKNGVYAFSLGNEIMYVSGVSGSSGLRDRILRRAVNPG